MDKVFECYLDGHGKKDCSNIGIRDKATNKLIVYKGFPVGGKQWLVDWMSFIEKAVSVDASLNSIYNRDGCFFVKITGRVVSETSTEIRIDGHAAICICISSHDELAEKVSVSFFDTCAEQFIAFLKSVEDKHSVYLIHNRSDLPRARFDMCNRLSKAQALYVFASWKAGILSAYPM